MRYKTRTVDDSNRTRAEDGRAVDGTYKSWAMCFCFLSEMRSILEKPKYSATDDSTHAHSCSDATFPSTPIDRHFQIVIAMSTMSISTK